MGMYKILKNKNTIVFLFLLFILSIFIFLILPHIKFTKEYVSNSTWFLLSTERPIGVYKMSIDSSIIIDPTNSKFDILKIHENYSIDTSFYFELYETDKILSRKIYFNKKDDGVIWRQVFGKGLKLCDTIGTFQKNQWYTFTGIRSYYIYSVYIDSAGQCHQYSLSYGLTFNIWKYFDN
jgi:hypothetical protein